jgi:hypothetical protein
LRSEGELSLPFSTISFEMLIRLVHEDPNGRLPSRLEARVVRGIQICHFMVFSQVN